MGRFIWFLIIFIFSVWLGLKIAQDPGYAVFAYQHWTVEMPLWFAIVAFIILVMILYGLLRFLDGIDFSLYRLKNWLKWRRKYKSYSKTNRGLLELIEGNWRGAEFYLLKGIPQSDAPLINYLGAAKAAHEQQAYDRRDGYLRKAHDLAPQAEIATGLTQAQLLLDQGQLEQSLATLDQLRTLAPKQGLVLKLLEKLYIRLGDWQSLIKLLPSLKKARLINEAQFQQFEKNTYLELLRHAMHKNMGLQSIRELWESIPKKYQHDPLLIYYYAKLMLLYPEAGGEVPQLITKALKKEWNKDLIRLYGMIQSEDPKRQLAQAEIWHKQYGEQAVLLLTLGRLCMNNQLWGKAKNYLESSLKLEPAVETYLAYGTLLEKLGDVPLSVQAYRDGLILSVAQIKE